MNKNEIPIMFCFDNNYVIPAGVAFYSMLEHCNRDYNYSLYVLHTDITKENQKKLVENIKKFSSFSKLEFINMKHRFQSLWDSISIKGHFSKEVMYKILVASIFPQYDKIITSDVDVVFLNDISDSYTSFDVNDDYYLAGIRMIGKYDWYIKTYSKKFEPKERKKLTGFCGGYIVFNLDKIRKDNMEEKFIKCFEENGHRIHQMEQDILNLCCYPHTKRLPLKYVACSYMWDVYKTKKDMQTDSFYSESEIKDAMKNTVQLHYATSTKPWKQIDSTKAEIWFEYLKKTLFFDDYIKYLPNNIMLSDLQLARLTYRLNNNQVSKIIYNLNSSQKDCVYNILRDEYSFRNRIRWKLESYKLYWYLRSFLKHPLFFLKPSFYKKVYHKIKKK